jgi:hypothetical protein
MQMKILTAQARSAQYPRRPHQPAEALTGVSGQNSSTIERVVMPPTSQFDQNGHEKAPEDRGFFIR